MVVDELERILLGIEEVWVNIASHFNSYVKYDGAKKEEWLATLN